MSGPALCHFLPFSLLAKPCVLFNYPDFSLETSECPSVNSNVPISLVQAWTHDVNLANEI